MPPVIDHVAGPSPKKRKLMHTPDGFENSKRATGKAPARKFASAFDDSKRSKASSGAILARNLRAPPPVAVASKEAHASRNTLAPVVRPSRIPVIQQPVAGPSSRPVLAESRHASVLAARRGASPVSPQLPVKPASRGSILQVQPVTGLSSKPALMQSRHASILAAHRNASPAPAEPPPKPISKGSIHQFQPVLPPPAPPKDPPRNLRPMQPPPPLAVGRPKPDPSKLKTILTTRLAIAMDPRTESGTDELLGIYLEQNAGPYIPPAERELQRGLKQSPEKASKSKSAKFTRGGLAERAQRIFAKHSTTLGLWYKDMELQAQRPQAHSRVAPDLCLRIVDVLHISSVASLQRSQSVPRLCIARCARVSPPRKTGEPEEVAAVLDFGNPGSAAARAHTLDDVKAERQLHIWRPWNATQTGESLIGLSGANASLFGLPPNCSILFCTRFRIAS